MQKVKHGARAARQEVFAAGVKFIYSKVCREISKTDSDIKGIPVDSSTYTLAPRSSWLQGLPGTGNFLVNKWLIF